MDLEEKIKALELLVSENTELKTQLEKKTKEAKNAEAENTLLVDRWMLEKMKDAERLNEVNFILMYHMNFGIRYFSIGIIFCEYALGFET